MVDETVDILIVGGGLTGVSLLLALVNSGLRVRLIDNQPLSGRVQPDFDARTLALAPASIRILEQLQLWPLLANDACPIDSIHVSEQYRFGTTRLQGSATEPLGYVLELQRISQALHTLADPHSILAPADLIALDSQQGLATIRYHDQERVLKASLIVGADGSWSALRRLAGLGVQSKAYNQQAIVANIALHRPHANLACERFTAFGPLAMLPMTEQRAALIWAMEPAQARRLLAVDERCFLQELQRAFGYRMGRLNQVGRRSSFPLQQMIMPRPAVWPLVFVGNAAQTLHPVAGQGFNLGLRDVAMLAQHIAEYGLNADMLARYQSARRYDKQGITRLTDGLVTTFSSALPGLGLVRSLGLSAADTVPGLKSILSRHARGFAGEVPDLACGIPLQFPEKP